MADYPQSFSEARRILGERESKKIGNNTYAERLGNGNIGIRLHNTHVVVFTADDHYILNSGGWRTKTTKDRINQLLPSNIRISQKKFAWYVEKNGHIMEFRDGMVV